MKKLSAKQLADAKKLQAIVDHYDNKEKVIKDKEDQANRAKLFNKVVPVIPQSTAIELRSQQEIINQSISPNPLADMAHDLGKCFQCGCNFTDAELNRQIQFEKPGQIFLCIHCYSDIQSIIDGDQTVSIGLPYAASQLCANDHATHCKKYQN